MAVSRFKELTADLGTAVPAISECLWRLVASGAITVDAHRSPRDFRVLVAGPGGV